MNIQPLLKLRIMWKRYKTNKYRDKNFLLIMYKSEEWRIELCLFLLHHPQ